MSHIPFDAHGLVLSAEGVVELSRDAPAVLGDGIRTGLDVDGLIAALGVEGLPLGLAIRALVAEGRAFRLRTELAACGAVEVLGSPVGVLCLISVRDIGMEIADGERMAMRVASATAQVAALREALEAAPVPVRVLDPDGAAVWRNSAAVARDAADPAASAGGRSLPLPCGGQVTIGPEPSEGALPEDRTLRRFIETVRETFAHLRVGLAIFDLERRLMLSNPALAEMFGGDRLWLSGRPTLRTVLDRLRETRQLPEQADFPKWRASLFTLFEPEGGRNYEDVWELPDGRSIQVVGRPHPLGGIAFVFEDVTEAIALQRWRSTAVEVRRATLDLLADGVAVFGADGRMRVANPAFLAQWELEPAAAMALHVGSLAAQCEPLCLDGGFWRDVRAAVAGGAGRVPWEASVGLRDGRVFKARVAPMPDGSTLIALADVTDSERIATALRERAEALEAAEQMRDMLVEHLSHRLRTPLNAVAGFAEMLADGRAGPLDTMQASFVAHIRDAAGQLVAGIESLSGLAIRDGGGDGDAVGPVAVGSAVMGAIGLLERRAAERGARLEADPSLNSATIEGNVGHVREQVYLLVAESVAAAAPGETLRFGATAGRDGVALWCRGLHRDPTVPASPTATPLRARDIGVVHGPDGTVSLEMTMRNRHARGGAAEAQSDV